MFGAMGAYSNVKKQSPWTSNRLVMGPWDHGARTNGSPWRDTAVPEFPLMAEVLRFFDEHLMGLDTGIRDEAPIHFHTVHGEKWQSAREWPPRRRFTIGHELGHWVLHRSGEKSLFCREAVVEADLSRASGSPASLDGAIRALRALEPTGNVEADRYRTHVLVKAILERGDDDTLVATVVVTASAASSSCGATHSRATSTPWTTVVVTASSTSSSFGAAHSRAP